MVQTTSKQTTGCSSGWHFCMMNGHPTYFRVAELFDRLGERRTVFCVNDRPSMFGVDLIELIDDGSSWWLCTRCGATVGVQY